MNQHGNALVGEEVQEDADELIELRHAKQVEREHILEQLVVGQLRREPETRHDAPRSAGGNDEQHPTRAAFHGALPLSEPRLCRTEQSSRQ